MNTPKFLFSSGLMLAVFAACSSGTSSPGGDGGTSNNSTSNSMSGTSSGACKAYHACDLLSVAEVNAAVSGGATAATEDDGIPPGGSQEMVTCLYAGTTMNTGLTVTCDTAGVDISLATRLIGLAGHTPMTVTGVGQAAVYDPPAGTLYVKANANVLVTIAVDPPDGGAAPSSSLTIAEQLYTTVSGRL